MLKNILVCAGMIVLPHTAIVILVLCFSGDFVLSADSEPSLNEIEQLLPHYAFDPIKAKRLALLEENLVTTLADVQQELLVESKGSSESLCNGYLVKYLSDYNDDSEAVGNTNGVLRAQQVVENPNLLFRMIRRLFLTLIRNAFETCGESEKWGSVIQEVVLGTFQTAKLHLPTERDFNDALLGILRIQYIYGLNATSHLRLGIFQDVNTKAVLSFDDCLLLADKAIDLQVNYLAYQWLAATQLTEQNIQLHQQIWEELMWELNRLWGKLMLKSGATSTDELHELLRGKPQLEMKKFGKFKYYATCRGQSYYRGPPLYCYHDARKPYYFIGPMKIEVHSEDPPILQFHNEISNKAIRFYQRKASEKRFERTPVARTHESQSNYGDFITSMNTLLDNIYLENNEEDFLYWGDDLEVKLRLTTDLSMGKYARPTQVTLYGALGGFYDFHHDSLQDSVDGTGSLGDRLATILMVMGDVKMGGYTAFPKMGVFAKPIKNSVILWYNLKRNGKPDLRSIHGGCPVILGLKQVARRGVDQFENMWHYPCHTDPDL